MITYHFSLQHNNIYSGGKVIDFDEGYKDLSSSFDCVKGNNARSISFDILTKDDSNNIPIISTGEMNGAFQIVMKRGVIGLTAYSADYFPPTGTVINDGKWHKVDVTYDGTTLRIYVDGRLDNASAVWNSNSTASMAKTINTGPSNNIYLGRSLWESYKGWKGQLRNVRFYNIEVSNITISVLIVY